MKINADRRLFWFLKDNTTLDLSEQSELDMYVQQVVTHGRRADIRTLFKNIGYAGFKAAFVRLKHFVPFEVRKFWEDFIGDN